MIREEGDQPPPKVQHLWKEYSMGVQITPEEFYRAQASDYEVDATERLRMIGMPRALRLLVGMAIVAGFIAALVAVAALIGALILTTPARAQSPEYKCTPPDVITIRDAGPGKAIVTYSNSVNRCSAEVRQRLRSPAGIEVDVHIQITGMDNDYRERITLNPVENYMMSFPAEGDLIDGETQEFIIMGGLA